VILTDYGVALQTHLFSTTPRVTIRTPKEFKKLLLSSIKDKKFAHSLFVTVYLRGINIGYFKYEVYNDFIKIMIEPTAKRALENFADMWVELFGGFETSTPYCFGKIGVSN